tara:strand:- start:1203 stop:1391 length:189 start_codon:yes stop_codon:yes gene_type:complete
MNVAKLAYKNLEVAQLKPTPKGGGLLARNVPERTGIENLEPRKRVAMYVAELRKARQGLKDG